MNSQQEILCSDAFTTATNLPEDSGSRDYDNDLTVSPAPYLAKKTSFLILLDAPWQGGGVALEASSCGSAVHMGRDRLSYFKPDRCFHQTTSWKFTFVLQITALYPSDNLAD
ncbi:unnamed protein product [Pleuronectes platessa]|uniref:Uncharacterized protein n=1 Tax=Pleuronectes platessa TaxID=8262 RepID=A0A9N7ZAM0_PLEPL|nr:unnamed protein product [Pleuronectes platessa]